MKRRYVLDNLVKGAAALGVVCLLAGGTAQGQCQTWTLNGDFDEGTLINVNHDDPHNNQLQLNLQAEPFPFINVAASARGTIVRINTDTGAIIGEYWTAPAGQFLNPSRTTVDAFGNVWAGNRNEAGGGLGSVVKIGIVLGGTRCDIDGTPNPLGDYLEPPFDYSTAVDRDGDGLIKTSRGLADVRPWPAGTDGAGGLTGEVLDADDECVLIYQRVGGDHVRHVSVDANNNVWTAGNFGVDNRFELLDGNTGAILASFDVGAGGYGGLVDGSGVIWSANRGPGPLTVLRYDTKNTLTTADDTWSMLDAPNAYGLGLDTNGHVWNAQYSSNQVRKFNPFGGLVGTFNTSGASNDRGVVVTPVDNDVWIANSGGLDVSRLDNNGGLVKVIPLGGDGVTPTGLAVDSNGKVWVTCLTSNTAKRIDPNGDVDGKGIVDLTVSLGAGAGPYNYSDMTGAVLLQAIQQGTWSVVWDGGAPGTPIHAVTWMADEPDGTSLLVEVRAADSEANLPAQAWVVVENGVPLLGVAGRYWEIRVTFARDPGIEDTAVLYELSLECDVPLDIKPGSCPNSFQRKSKGVLPVALVSSDTFDATMVDIATVLLSRADGVGGSVAPLEGPRGPHSVFADVATPFDGAPCDCHELEGDGLVDLMMKFSSPEVVEMLELSEFAAGAYVELIVTGSRVDGTPFTGRDCLRLVPSKK